MIEAFAAKSGSRSLRVDGIALHSPYDPVREAHRFVLEGIGTEPPSAVVVLGEGLGYVGHAVKDLFPSARVIRVHYSAEIFRAAGPLDGPAWAPGQKSSLADFLLGQIGEFDMEGLRVLEWPPSARLFPSIARDANDTVRRVLQQLNGSLVTTIAAGRLWLRNSIENFLAFESVLVGRPCAEDRPVLIAAPGPSLEESAKLIRTALPFIDLWALPSSLPLLREEGLTPDLVVMTDPGYYSMHHLSFAVPDCPLAMPISAARGAWSLPTRASEGLFRAPFLLSQPGFFEDAIFHAAGVRPPQVPPHGTVAATALDLARSFTRAPVIVAGLDMCTRDISSHARPNAFDTLLHLRISRVFPHDGLTYERSAGEHATRLEGMAGIRASLSLRTYSGWFDQAEDGDPHRVYRLLPSPVALGRMRSLDAEGLRDLLGRAHPGFRGPQVRKCDPYPELPQRLLIVSRLISGWMTNLANAAKAMKASATLDAVAMDPPVCALAHDIEPGLLLEAGRKMRRGDREGALRTAGEMLEGCGTFLRGLQVRTGADR
jgi:hypothetical protein